MIFVVVMLIWFITCSMNDHTASNGRTLALRRYLIHSNAASLLMRRNNGGWFADTLHYEPWPLYAGIRDPRSAPDYSFSSQECMRILCTLHIVFLILFSCNDMTKCGDGTHGEGWGKPSAAGTQGWWKKERRDRRTHMWGVLHQQSRQLKRHLGTHVPNPPTKSSWFAWIESEVKLYSFQETVHPL